MGNQQETEIECCICGIRLHQLASHLLAWHSLTTQQYKALFPNAEITSKVVHKRRVKTNLERYNVELPNQEKAQEGNRRCWQNPIWKKEMKESHRLGTLRNHGVENVFYSKELQQEYQKRAKATVLARYGVENVGSIPEVQEKIRKSACTPANKAECLLLTLLPTNCKYTGDGSFWIRLKTNQPKNPDFVAEPFSETKTIVELFGEFYHKPEEEAYIVSEYSKVGVRCLVIWNQEITSKRKQLIAKAKIDTFFSDSPTTTRNQVANAA